jgi:CO dehydrogenase/acetyl-CoA synthase alpha subunit
MHKTHDKRERQPMPPREGSLEAPTRHPIAWKSPEYYDEEATFHELERIFDICHGCRRCVSLCGSFPTLFDLVDESKTARSTASTRRTIGRSSTSATCATCAT